jgi:deazaflavin-dependent oxidoreductase (nitroreductase family)
VELKNHLHPTTWQKIFHRIGSTQVGSRVFSLILPTLDRFVLRLTGGRASLASTLAGLPIVTLTTQGVKSGLPRSVPLVGLPDNETIVLIASNWGQTKHPAWYLNLRANPQAQISLAGHSRNYLAREASAEEYKLYWNQAVNLYAGYAAYLKTAGLRRIPIVVLTPITPYSTGLPGNKS